MNNIQHIKTEEIMMTAFFECVVFCAFCIGLIALTAVVYKLGNNHLHKLPESHEDEYVDYEEIPYDEAA